MRDQTRRSIWQSVLIAILLTVPQGCATAGVTGTLTRLDTDSLTILESDSTSTHSYDDLSLVQVSQGTRSYRGLGAVVGSLVGITASFVVFNSGGSTALCDQTANQDAASSGLCLGLFALGGLTGAGLGSIAGGAITVEHWVDAPTESLVVGIRIRLPH